MSGTDAGIYPTVCRIYNATMPLESVQKVADADFPTRWGHFRILGFEGKVVSPEPCKPGKTAPPVRTEGAVALIMGDIHTGSPIVRIHSQCLTGDVFHSLRCDCRAQLEIALRSGAIQRKRSCAALTSPPEYNRRRRRRP